MSIQQRILVAYLEDAINYLDHTNLSNEEWSRYFYRVLKTAARRAEDILDQEAGV